MTNKTNKCIIGFGIYNNEEKTEVEYINILIRNNDNAYKIYDFLDTLIDEDLYKEGNNTISLANCDIDNLIYLYEANHEKTTKFLTRVKIEKKQEHAFICIKSDEATPNGAEEAELEYQASQL